jgi:hypothetical protein
MKLLFTVFLLFFSQVFSGTGECIEKPDSYRYLSGEIGDIDKSEPHVYLMACDTMYINEGVTVNVFENTYLAFSDPKPSNAIIINGTMVVNGSNNNKVRIASSIDRKNEPWIGIIIKNKGKLILNSSIFYGSNNPINSYSSNFRIVNSFFFNAQSILVDGFEEYKIPEGGYIPSFSLTGYNNSIENSPISEPAYPVAKPAGPKMSFWRSPWTYIGAGIAFAGGAAVTYLIIGNDGRKTDGDDEIRVVN